MKSLTKITLILTTILSCGAVAYVVHRNMNDVVWFSEKILGKLVSLKERPPNPTPKKENGENDQLKDEKNQPSVSLTVTDFSKAFGIRIDESNGEVYLGENPPQGVLYLQNQLVAYGIEIGWRRRLYNDSACGARKYQFISLPSIDAAGNVRFSYHLTFDCDNRCIVYLESFRPPNLADVQEISKSVGNLSIGGLVHSTEDFQSLSVKPKVCSSLWSGLLPLEEVHGL